tara:strand:+ start:4359 stop:4595 length:237 start_codon:yes stop_codon:yes gene_type:complete
MCDETVVMPRELHHPHLFIGEFSESISSVCPVCAAPNDGEIDEDCYLCEGSGVLHQTVMISWSTIKDIYKKAVENLET